MSAFQDLQEVQGFLVQKENRDLLVHRVPLVNQAFLDYLVDSQKDLRVIGDPKDNLDFQVR